MNNIMITGYPRTGKTTLIMKVVEKTTKNVAGFYTEEIRNELGGREGFEVIGVRTGKKGMLAHVNAQSDKRVGKYYVTLKEFEEIALEEMKLKTDIMIIDEIGKMELFSRPFKEKLLKCLESKNVLATITMRGGGAFVEQIKKREDVELLEITVENREEMIQKIITKIEEE